MASINSNSDSNINSNITSGIATLTFNQPDARNALTPSMLDTLATLTQQYADDDEVRCVIITGAGEQAFCAGGDISGIVEQGNNSDESALVELLEGWSEAALLLHTMPKPTIAALNGVAAGAGMGIALACDLRFASPAASFVTAFARLAMPGDFGGSYFLSQLVGPAKARELYFLSERIRSEEALALGLINRIFPAADLLQETNAIAQRLVQAPAPMFRAMKKNLNAALTESAATVIRQEARLMIECALSDEARQATAAFFDNKASK